MMAAVPQWCVELARSDAVRDMAAEAYFTVNFPDGPAGDVKGVRWAGLGEQVFHDRFEPYGHDDQGRQVWRRKQQGR